MGIQKNIAFKGTVDNIIYYQWKGINCIRQKPATVNQSSRSMELAGLFGRAARCSTIVRSLLGPVLPQGNQRPLMYAMNSAFRQWFANADFTEGVAQQELSAFTGLRFREAGPSPANLIPGMSISRQPGGQLSVAIPPMDIQNKIAAPAATQSIALQFLAVGLPLAAPETAAAVMHTQPIPYTGGEQPAINVSLPIGTETGKLVLVALGMEFSSGGPGATSLLGKGRGGIVGSFYN